MTMMATNCSSTRSRISFCEVLRRAAAHHVDEAEQQHDRDRSRSRAGRERRPGIRTLRPLSTRPDGETTADIQFSAVEPWCRPTPFEPNGATVVDSIRYAILQPRAYHASRMCLAGRACPTSRWNYRAILAGSSHIMSSRILVLGAAGRFGRAGGARPSATPAGRSRAWCAGRARARAPTGTEVIEVDARDHAAVAAAARGADVVLHALNPPYTRVVAAARLPLAYSAITAAETRRRHAAVSRQPLQLRHGACRRSSTRRRRCGRRRARDSLRVAIEERMAEAAERGVRTIILRAGDFSAAGAAPGSTS